MELPNADIDLFSHELKHSFQFEVGEISLGFSIGATGPAFLLDKTDEAAGYERQSLLVVFRQDQILLKVYPLNMRVYLMIREVLVIMLRYRLI